MGSFALDVETEGNANCSVTRTLPHGKFLFFFIVLRREEDDQYNTIQYVKRHTIHTYIQAHLDFFLFFFSFPW